jgi:AcrR family transcriptional regulator
MKTTKAQQQATRSRIVRAAVELFRTQGYDAVTMKDIARAAGVGDATVYSYFATKDRLLLGFFDEAAAQALAVTRAATGFDGYDLASRLQRLVDALLDVLEPDRAVVDMARRMLARAPLLLLGDQLQAKQLLKAAVLDWMDAAVATGELPPTDHARAISGLLVDGLQGVVALWLHDDSPDHARTTQLVDQLLGLVVAMLKAGLPDRLVQLAGFVLRSHLSRLIDGWGTLHTQAPWRQAGAAAAADPAPPPPPRKAARARKAKAA